MECSLSLCGDFRDRIVRRYLRQSAFHSSQSSFKRPKSHKTRINPQFPTKQRSVWRRSYLWTFFGLLKNPHETRTNTRENDYCKKIKSWHESWTRYEVSWKGQSKIGCVLYTHPFYCEFVGLGRRFPSIYAVILMIFEGFLGRSFNMDDEFLGAHKIWTLLERL